MITTIYNTILAIILGVFFGAITDATKAEYLIMVWIWIVLMEIWDLTKEKGQNE
jgi:hypothetical protein